MKPRIRSTGCWSVLFAVLSTPALADVQIMNIDPATLPAEIKGEVAARPSAPYLLPAGLRYTKSVLGQGYGAEVEPNGTTATATPIASGDVVVPRAVVPQWRHRLLQLHRQRR